MRDFYRGSSNEGRQAIKEALGDKLSEALPITVRVWRFIVLVHAIFSARLAFKSEELAEYAAKQFVELFADFCFLPEPDKKE